MNFEWSGGSNYMYARKITNEILAFWPFQWCIKQYSTLNGYKIIIIYSNGPDSEMCVRKMADDGIAINLII